MGVLNRLLNGALDVGSENREAVSEPQTSVRGTPAWIHRSNVRMT